MKFQLYKFFFILLFLFVSFVSAQTNQNEGIEFYRQGEYEKAIQILQATVQTNEKDRLAWTYLGASYVNLRKDKQAAKAFQKADTIRLKTAPSSNYDKELKITRKPHIGYTDEARRNLTTGTIKVAVEFRSDGKIGFVFPFRILPDGLTENAVDAARNIEFEPAVKNGKTVTVVRFIEYSISI